jgi:hypothetical protein
MEHCKDHDADMCLFAWQNVHNTIKNSVRYSMILVIEKTEYLYT